MVVTHERPPVSISGDTVAFSAKAFKTQPNANVEQLLKKLPGMAVDRDGTIRSQGKEVKMLVDGKPRDDSFQRKTGMFLLIVALFVNIY